MFIEAVIVFGLVFILARNRATFISSDYIVLIESCFNMLNLVFWLIVEFGGWFNIFKKL